MAHLRTNNSLLGLLKGTWWDLTTFGDWGRHVTKYAEGGVGLLY
ncbi:MAG: hypothetical protein ABJC98_17905 [Bacteroidota bacterium]